MFSKIECVSRTYKNAPFRLAHCSNGVGRIWRLRISQKSKERPHETACASTRQTRANQPTHHRSQRRATNEHPWQPKRLQINTRLAGRQSTVRATTRLASEPTQNVAHIHQRTSARPRARHTLQQKPSDAVGARLLAIESERDQQRCPSTPPGARAHHSEARATEIIDDARSTGASSHARHQRQNSIENSARHASTNLQQ
mmetsp:Transcript_12585/g.21283  ORF Transcript_12585/g.21283 Transcript_12585/m.21283 type:complete len:200 (+) Transcript_12585:250-849(+)